MRALKYKDLALNVVRALRCTCVEAAHQLPATTPQLVSQYLGANPRELVAAHAEDDFESAIEIVMTRERGRKIRLKIENLVRNLMDGVAASEEVPKASGITPFAAITGSGRRLLVTRDQEEECYRFDFVLPDNVLQFMVYVDGDAIVQELVACAQETRRLYPDNELATLIGFHRHTLTGATSSDWFMSVEDHTDLMQDLHKLGESDRRREYAAEFIGQLEYSVASTLFKADPRDNCGKRALDTSLNVRKGTAEKHPELSGLWYALAQCEPLAFLLEFAQRHAPLFTNDELMDQDIAAVDVEDDEHMCSLEYCMFLDTQTGRSPDDSKEEDDTADDDCEPDDPQFPEDDDGLEPFEPEFDDEGRATNVGQNMQNMMEERLARDE